MLLTLGHPREDDEVGEISGFLSLSAPFSFSRETLSVRRGDWGVTLGREGKVM